MSKSKLTLRFWHLISLILPKVKIGYYVPVSLGCFKCQKYGHLIIARREWDKCANYGEKDPDHLEENCLKEIRCPHCRLSHRVTQDVVTSIKKRKRIIISKSQEECDLSGSNRNRRVLRGRKHFRLCFTDGGSNQLRKQI